MTGKLKLQGDMMIATAMQGWFRQGLRRVRARRPPPRGGRGVGVPR